MDMSLPYVRRSVALGWLLAPAIGGCLTGPSSIGEPRETDSEVGSSSGAGSTTGDVAPQTDDGSTSAMTSTSSESGEPAAICPEWSPCGTPVVCGPMTHHCGERTAIDDDGCPRPFCESNEECPAGYSCFRPNDWGDCGAHGCYEEPSGACECGFGLDCNANAHCVPEALVPPFGLRGDDFCAQFHDDPDTCTTVLDGYDLGRCAIYAGWRFPPGGTAADATPVSRCEFTLDGSAGGAWPTCDTDPGLTPLWRAAGDDVVVILSPTDTIPAIFGIGPDWEGCEAPNAPATELCFFGCS